MKIIISCRPVHSFVWCNCLQGVLYSQWHGYANAAALWCSSQETLPAWGEGGVQRLTTTECLPCPNPPHSGEKKSNINKIFLSRGKDLSLLYVRSNMSMSIWQHYNPNICSLMHHGSLVPFLYSLALSVHPFLLQIQNQLPGAIFPYVFYPVKLPKSITMDSGLLTNLICPV